MHLRTDENFCFAVAQERKEAFSSAQLSLDRSCLRSETLGQLETPSSTINLPAASAHEINMLAFNNFAIRRQQITVRAGGMKCPAPGRRAAINSR